MKQRNLFLLAFGLLMVASPAFADTSGYDLGSIMDKYQAAATQFGSNITAVALKLCKKMDVELSGADRAAANEILRVMAGDAAEMVRRALAVTLRASDVMPRDVALRLAEDVESIATPILTFSPVFSDADLAEIVRRADPARQIAVASRQSLSEGVTDALAECGCEDAVATAAGNPGASFSEQGLVISLDRFRASQKVTRAVAYREVGKAVVNDEKKTQKRFVYIIFEFHGI